MPKVTFLPSNKVWEGPAGTSLLEAAREMDIDVEAACGGVCACSTCHMIVHNGDNNLSEKQDNEEDRLDRARGVTLRSRLGCQALIQGDVTVFVPPMRLGATPHAH